MSYSFTESDIKQHAQQKGYALKDAQVTIGNLNPKPVGVGSAVIISPLLALMMY